MSRDIQPPTALHGPPLAPAPAHGRVHPIVYIDYRIRLLGYLVGGLMVASTLLEQRPGAREAGPLLWTLLVAHTFVWPHLVFLVSRNSTRPQRVEKAALVLDGFLAGIWLELIGFALWPSMVGLFTLLISSMSVGGRRMAGASFAALAAGALIAAGIAGFVFIPDTGVRTAVLCVLGVLAYGAMYASTVKRQTTKIVAANREKAALYDEVKRRSDELARSLERLQALHEVTTAISSSIELNVVLDTVLKHAVHVAGADAGAIVEVEPGATVFHHLASRGLSEKFMAGFAAIRVDPQDRVIREAIDHKRPVQVHDLTTATNFLLREPALGDGFHALLAVPMVQERITRGLMLLRREAGPYAADSVELLVALAAQAAVAVENAGLYRQLQQQQHSLEVASRAKSDFMANMSHELRTPLNAILGYTELLLDNVYGDVPGKIRPVLQRVDRSSRHLLGMIDEVLDIAKIEAGKLKPNLAPCLLSDVIREVMLAMQALAQEKGLRLGVMLPQDVPPLMADERQLSQVLFNLVGNAIKFTERGEVGVSVTFDCQRLIIAVRDTGPGIAPEDRERIFQEFEQGEMSPTAPKGGAGLGLAISRRVVEMHGGDLWVESTPGSGSTFFFSLPFVAPPGEAAASQPVPAEQRA
jgi:signal transduction histidine kinase